MDDKTLLQSSGEKVEIPAAAATSQLPASMSSTQNPPPPVISGSSSGNSRRAEFRGYNFALIICQHPVTKKFLAVHETKNRGWWIPGGGVDAGETFREAAIREAMEEAGVEIQLKGVLKIEHALLSDRKRKSTQQHHHDPGSFFKMRVIFYAEPKDLNNCEPKSVADVESLGAEWLTPREFLQKQHIRGNELLDFAPLVDMGKIYPLDVLDEGI